MFCVTGDWTGLVNYYRAYMRYTSPEGTCLKFEQDCLFSQMQTICVQDTQTCFLLK